MVRLVVVAVLTLFLAQESSLGSLLAGAECLETCPDDSPAGRCSPVCVTCACGAPVNPVPMRAAALETPVPRVVLERATPAVAWTDGHPSDISHVPMSLAA